MREDDVEHRDEKVEAHRLVHSWVEEREDMDAAGSSNFALLSEVLVDAIPWVPESLGAWPTRHRVRRPGPFSPMQVWKFRELSVPSQIKFLARNQKLARW